MTALIESTTLQEVLRFWLVKGVDGFRIDAAAHLYESVNVTQDEPSSSPGDHDPLKHTLTMFQPETYELVTEWRELLDNFQEVDSKVR